MLQAAEFHGMRCAPGRNGLCHHALVSSAPHAMLLFNRYWWGRLHRQSSLGIPMRTPARFVLVLSALTTLIAAAGFAFQLPWALWLWPWQDGRLSYIFIGSIAAAIGAPILWIGVRGVSAAIPGGALNLIVALGGMSLYVFSLWVRDGGTRLLLTALVLGALALINVWLFLATYRLPAPDTRPTPAVVRASFGLFAVVLVSVSAAMVLRAPHVFPWPLKADSSVMFGLIFLGASLYFIYGVVRPFWFNAFGQLLGFLAYDVVLLYPYAQHFANVKPDHLPSLTVYMTVIIYSLLLALYFLVLDPRTRIGSAKVPEPAA